MPDTKLNLEKMSRRMGAKNAKILLEVLAKDKQFVDAIDTTTGREFLREIVEELHKRVELIIDEKDTPEVRAEIRAFRAILNNWTSTLGRYSQNLKKAMS